MVDIDPACPVFSACSRSSASPPRISPITSRSGRNRSAEKIRSRIVISPFPCASALRVSNGTTCDCCNCSSLASSSTRTRSSGAMNELSTFSTDVLPELVPPDTITFLCIATIVRSSSIPSSERLPYRSSFAASSVSRLNLRIDTTVPHRLSGGITACTREPSGSRASSWGCASSSWRPTDFAMLAAAARSAGSLANTASVACSLPPRSMYTFPGPLTMISETSSSSRYRRIGSRKRTRNDAGAGLTARPPVQPSWKGGRFPPRRADRASPRPAASPSSPAGESA